MHLLDLTMRLWIDSIYIESTSLSSVQQVWMIQGCWTNFKLTKLRYDDSAQDQRHLDLQKAIQSKSKPGMINRSSKTQRRDMTGKVAEPVAASCSCS